MVDIPVRTRTLASAAIWVATRPGARIHDDMTAIDQALPRPWTADNPARRSS